MLAIYYTIICDFDAARQSAIRSIQNYCRLKLAVARCLHALRRAR